MNIDILPSAFDDQANDIARLWACTLGKDWGTDEPALRQILQDARIHKATADGKTVAFSAFREMKERASVLAIAVAPDFQRRGIGTRLLCAGLSRITAKKILIASGAGAYFWPGVPEDLTGATDFFTKNGFRVTETGFDLVGNGDCPPVPPPAGITLECAQASDTAAILAFEEKHFPTWLVWFSEVVRREEHKNILLAKDAGGSIVASVLMSDPRNDFRWNRILGDRISELGTLGVREDMREKGLGLALAARATEIMRERGAQKIFVGWTWLDKWYGTLGYKVWRRYRIGGRA